MSGIGEVATESRKGGIWQEEARLGKVINRVSEIVVNLEHRLSPVLRSQPPQGSDSTEKEIEAVPDLVQRLRERNTAMEKVETHISTLLERLEI